MTLITDEALIVRIVAGEKQLFEQLIRKYNQKLYRLGMSVLAHEEETEDAMQTVYIKAYEHLGEFEHRSAFGTWLIRIMLNQCYEQKRKSKRTTYNLENVNTPNMNNVVNELANKELGNALQRAIEKLPEKYRLVFVLRTIEDMSVRDTCSILNIGESNVKVRLNRAKLLLRKDLNGYLNDYVYNFHLSKCDKMVAAVFDHLKIS